MRTRQQPNLDLDTWLETGLRAGLDPLATDTVPVSRYLLGSPAPRLGARRRLLAGSASAVLLIGGGAISAAAASTGTLDPGAWGRHVSAAVETCRLHLAAGQSGLGPCVSAIASAKNESEHRATEADEATRSSHSRSSTAPGHGSDVGEHGQSTPGHEATPAGGQGATPNAAGGNPADGNTHAHRSRR